MLEKLVYFISSFSLLFWTVFSNKKSLDESLAYVWVVTILLAVRTRNQYYMGKESKETTGNLHHVVFNEYRGSRFLLCIKLQSFCKRFKVFDFEFLQVFIF